MLDINTFAQCEVHTRPELLQAIVRTESSGNQFAIGVVNGYLQRQPRTKEEAVATVLALKERGFNYSMGLAQVNQVNLQRFGLTAETAFDVCSNLKAGAAIFEECYARATKQFSGEGALRASFSCYYSGNFNRGQQPEGGEPSYAQKVMNNISTVSVADTLKPKTPAIPIFSTKAAKGARREKPNAKRGDNENGTTVNVPKKGTWDAFGEL